MMGNRCVNGCTARATLLLALCAVVPGCVTMNDTNSYCVPDDIELATPVAPGVGEAIILEHASIIVDASGSMYPKSSFPVAKELARSFVNGMPVGAYAASALSFGGAWQGNWVYQPPQLFDREVMHSAVARMEHIKRSTPLETALLEVGVDLVNRPGAGAIVLFSDGRAITDETLDAAAALLAEHPGPLCFHTVHVGPHEDGVLLLKSLANMSACGTFRRASDVNSIGGMQQFLREVFFGAPGAAGVDVGDYVVRFGKNKSVIPAQYSRVIDAAADELRGDTSLRAEIVGHTDSTAGRDYNRDLSRQRAAVVRSALMERGIAGDRLDAIGAGESQPIASNATAAGRQQNRRVVINIVD